MSWGKFLFERLDFPADPSCLRDINPPPSVLSEIASERTDRQETSSSRPGQGFFSSGLLLSSAHFVRFLFSLWRFLRFPPLSCFTNLVYVVVIFSGLDRFFLPWKFLFPFPSFCFANPTPHLSRGSIAFTTNSLFLILYDFFSWS